MSESEKLAETISEFEAEVVQLETDIADLEQQLVTATTTAETAIAQAERQQTKAAERAAVDAEQACQRLAQALTRKRLALQAATADLQTARHGAAASERAALLIQLETALDELSAVAQSVDDCPTDLSAWASLRVAVIAAQKLFRRCGDRSNTLLVDWGQLAKFKLEPFVTQAEWTLREPDRPLPVYPPRVSELLRLVRARTLVRQMMASN